MKARYIRISTLDKGQKTDRQDALTQPNEQVFTDAISGSISFAKRPAGKALVEAIEAGIIFYVSTSQLDRWGRSAMDIQNTLDYFKSKGVCVRIDNLGMESILPSGKSNPSFKMVTDILANLSELQRDSILENQAQGIAVAKAKGNVYKGRIKGTVESDSHLLKVKYKNVVKELKTNPTLSLQKIATLCNESLGKGDTKLSPNTVRKVKMLLEKQENNKGVN